MTSLGNTPRLRTNCRMMLMREKAFQEEQRKRQKMMTGPRVHPGASRSLSSGTNGPTAQPSQVLFRTNLIIEEDHQGHNQLDPSMLGDDLTPVDSINTPYSLTPSSMTTSVSEYDALFEDINEIVEKESNANSSFISEKSEKGTKVKVGSKASLKTSSSCPIMRAAKLTLPSKLDPSDFPDIDSYKKEKHNIVEKKRRYKINDCIQELADLLPQTYDVDLNMKKGYILEKSVEYIQELKKDSEMKKETEGRVRELERENRQLQLELQALKRSQEAVLFQQRQRQQQQQQQQHQQFLLVSGYRPQQQQQQRSPLRNQTNPIVLSLGEGFSDCNNNIRQHQQQQQGFRYDASAFGGEEAFHGQEGGGPSDQGLDHGLGHGAFDADSLMSNLQVSSELSEMDRQELNGFVDLEVLMTGDDVVMADFDFNQAGGVRFG